jgi:hypothetical protein
VALQHRAAGAQGDQPAGRLLEPVAVQVPAAVGHRVPDRDPTGDQLGGEPREQLLQGLLAACQQRVDVAALRDTPPVGAGGGELVAVEHRHLPVGVGEHPGGQQPRHARPQHHHAIADPAQ